MPGAAFIQGAERWLIDSDGNVVTFGGQHPVHFIADVFFEDGSRLEVVAGGWPRLFEGIARLPNANRIARVETRRHYSTSAAADAATLMLFSTPEA